jgi:uncharacterized protein YbjQ (UPF0145 family)
MSVEEVEIHTSPWVSGARSVVHFGPVKADFFLADDLIDDSAAFTKAEDELLEALRDKARARGANAVLGLEVTLDPFARSETGVSGMSLRAVGTAVRVGPIP